MSTTGHAKAERWDRPRRARHTLQQDRRNNWRGEFPETGEFDNSVRNHCYRCYFGMFHSVPQCKDDLGVAYGVAPGVPLPDEPGERSRIVTGSKQRRRDYTVLKKIRRNPGKAASELAKLMGWTVQAISPVIRRLEECGDIYYDMTWLPSGPRVKIWTAK